MTNSFRKATLAGLLCLGVIPLHAGGWVVITLQDLPEQVVAGQPLSLTFAVRQHGQTLLSGLNASVEATDGSRFILANAGPASEPGYYVVWLAFPSGGDWTLTIDSGFGGTMDSTQVPLTVVDPGATVRPLSTAARGQRLFLTKGCVTCHGGNRAVPPNDSLPAPQLWTTAPQLSAGTYPAEFVKKLLATPPRNMPNLHLRPDEIAALVEFLKRDVGAARVAESARP